jgi:hypothetical protein
MRKLVLLLTVALAGTMSAAAAADGDIGGVGLFSGADDSPVEVTPGLWLTHGFARLDTASGDSGKVWQNANLLVTADLELRVPGHKWLGLWARGGSTVTNHKADSDDTSDVDSEYAVAEVNLVLTLVGRDSPIYQSDDYPRSTLDLYAGGRYFREIYDAELASGVKRELDTTWAGPQVGLRGRWYLQDTYDLDGLRGWSLTMRSAIMPWMHMEGSDRRDGAKAYDLSSNRGYGFELAAGAEWRR